MKEISTAEIMIIAKRLVLVLRSGVLTITKNPDHLNLSNLHPSCDA